MRHDVCGGKDGSAARCARAPFDVRRVGARGHRVEIAIELYSTLYAFPPHVRARSSTGIKAEHLVQRRLVTTEGERDIGGRLLRGRGRRRHQMLGLGLAIARVGEQRVTLWKSI